MAKKITYVDLLLPKGSDQVVAIRCSMQDDGTVNVRRFIDDEIAISTVAALRKQGVFNSLTDTWENDSPPKGKEWLKPSQHGADFLRALPREFNASMHSFRADVHHDEPPHLAAS